MTRHRWQSAVLVVPAIAAGLLVTSCAKQPAMTAATSAPAPANTTGGATPAPARNDAGSVKRVATSPSTTGGNSARPSLADFTAQPALEDVHFDFDKYEIRPGDAKILDADARWLKDHASDRVLIEGHADERGTNEYNVALGERRAKATMTYLVGQGIRAERMTMISYGAERPLCNEHHESCWARNRRTHLMVKAG